MLSLTYFRIMETREIFYRNKKHTLSFLAEPEWTEDDIQKFLVLGLYLMEMGYSPEASLDTSRGLMIKEKYPSLHYDDGLDEALEKLRVSLLEKTTGLAQSASAISPN